MVATDVTADFQAILTSHVFKAPQGVEIRRGGHGLSLHVTHPVRAGEVIYQADEIRIPADARQYRALVRILGQVHDLRITTMHTVRYDGIRTFDIPGCFMNHSCDP